MAYLVLVRHGQSEWNLLGQWTGLTDVSLTDDGREEARRAARTLEDIDLHRAYTSKLKRAKHTLDEIMEHLDYKDIQRSEHEELNERDYGDLTGKNKWQVKEEYGEEKFMKWRRSWDHPVPGGETLKDVSGRVLPFYEQHILNDLKNGKNVIVAAHGNSLRALIKHLDRIADDDAHTVEIMTGEVIVYEVGEAGELLKKEIRLTNDKKV
ncbi:MAG TPA: 2,3-diphosphoglycerate-dependent phosphoglycerate mutase [Candidatus Chromulinivoraceae bacterium]|nr:2,3-diphosphoglycerate-dependent phosphoglycerate mutase [Candidatus Chromulinivoraceae bacterium]